MQPITVTALPGAEAMLAAPRRRVALGLAAHGWPKPTLSFAQAAVAQAPAHSKLRTPRAHLKRGNFAQISAAITGPRWLEAPLAGRSAENKGTLRQM